jgi:uncharacterized membrane protein YgcG
MWDFDFQGIIVNPAEWSALEFAAFANAASYQYGVLIGADDASAMTLQQRTDYLATLDGFLDGIHSGGYQGGSDQNSYYRDPADSAPLGFDFIQTFGWMPHVQQMAGYDYWTFLTQDIDPEFLEAISDNYLQGYISGSGSSATDLTTLLLVNSALAGTDNDEEVIVAGHWEIVANGSGNTYGTSSEGDGANYLAGLAGITAALPALVDAFFNEVILHPSITLTAEQQVKFDAFKAVVRAMGAQLAEIPDNAVLDLGGGLMVTGSELKSTWALLDIWINPANTPYDNGTTRGEANYNFGDPKVSFNIDTLMDYCDSPAEMIYLVLHELGHLTQAGLQVNRDLQAGTVTSEYNEQFASTIALAIAQATQQPTLATVTYGYLPTVPSFTVPTTGTTGGTGGTGGSTGDTGGTGGTTGGTTGGSTGGTTGGTSGGGGVRERENLHEY